MAEAFSERTAGIWVPIIVYILGGAYMLAFWGLFDRGAYHLMVLGAVSLLIAVALFRLSRWGFWVGLFTFPIYFAVFLSALLTSVNLAGFYSNPQTTAFNTSMILYLIFLTFSLLLLIDKRNHLKSDRILDLLKLPRVQQKPETASK